MILWDRDFLKLQFSEIVILWSFNNSSFSIAIKGNKNSLRFEIDNESHIEDEGINGLLGFTMAKSYSVSFKGLFAQDLFSSAPLMNDFEDK